jgi:hypothetical protein
MAHIQGKLTATTAVVSLTQLRFPVRVVLTSQAGGRAIQLSLDNSGTSTGAAVTPDISATAAIGYAIQFPIPAVTLTGAVNDTYLIQDSN